jgi:pyruvate-formate lyase-activating enzyme
MKKVLFTTPVKKIPEDTFKSKQFFKFYVPSFGLKFLKENIPEIDILEYPSYDEFKKKLEEEYEILGISFYTIDIPIVKEMIKIAKSLNVKEIWGGNCGVLNDEIVPLFNKVFYGYSEDHISKELRGRGIKKINHPLLISEKKIIPWKIIDSIPKLRKIGGKIGFLFTSRGCNMGCIFCQSPTFENSSEISLENIENVLCAYKKYGIRNIFIGDNCFNPRTSHSKKVMELLNELDFKWACMSRADFLKDNVEQMKELGFSLCLIGMESLREENLELIKKQETVKNILEVIEELKENNIDVRGTYILGFPNDTKKSIKEDVKKLFSLEIDVRFAILTPLPHTPSWTILSKYGPYDPDYSKYDCQHLVWNHPNFKRRELEEFCLKISHILMKKWIWIYYIKSDIEVLKYFIHNLFS